MSAFMALLLRDLQLAMRRKSEVLTALFFFVVVAALFPLAIGPARDTLRMLAPGVLWVGALLASLLALGRLFEADARDGTLEQLLLSGRSLTLLVVAKITAHWLLCGMPLVLLAPLLGVMFDVPRQALGVLALSLLIGTPVLSFLGAIGAALTLGVRGGGVLLALLILPLYVPVLVFGAGAVESFSAGLGATAHLSVLMALLLLSVFFSPWVTAQALRLALE